MNKKNRWWSSSANLTMLQTINQFWMNQCFASPNFRSLLCALVLKAQTLSFSFSESLQFCTCWDFEDSPIVWQSFCFFCIEHKQGNLAINYASEHDCSCGLVQCPQWGWYKIAWTQDQALTAKRRSPCFPAFRWTQSRWAIKTTMCFVSKLTV